MLHRRQQGGPQILSKNASKPTVWKRYIDDIFSLWDISKPGNEQFIEQANSHHPTTKFTAEISETETTFLDTVIYKGERFKEQSILDKPTETFQYTHYTSCHPSSVKMGFVKGEALRFLRTNSLPPSLPPLWPRRLLCIPSLPKQPGPERFDGIFCGIQFPVNMTAVFCSSYRS